MVSFVLYLVAIHAMALIFVGAAIVAVSAVTYPTTHPTTHPTQGD